METYTTLGSFIPLMFTLAVQVRYATSVPNLSWAQVLARLPLTHLLARSFGRGKEEQLRLHPAVFRNSNANQSASS